jgi:acyl carrier protein
VTEAQIYEQLTEIFQDFFADSSITLKPETVASDIEGWDSVNHINIIMAAESRFGVRMQTSEIENLTNVGTLVDAIKKKLGDRGV